MRDFIDRFLARVATRGEAGQGMVEYGLILVFVVFVVFVAMTLFGAKVANIFNDAGNSLSI